MSTAPVDLTRPTVPAAHYDVVVVGGGHNGLVAAAYLAQAGRSVLVLERLAHTGGAAVSAEAFAGLPARLSRYSYLVSLLPERIVRDLGLRLELRSRAVASYTPVRRGGRDTGLLIERDEGVRTAQSFADLTGSDREYAAWRRFYVELADLAAVLAPTLTEPLVTQKQLRSRVDPDLWDAVVEQPLGRTLEARFADDTVRGVVATDALIGTFADLESDSLAQNRCLLYHLIGNGTGEWRVPVGGMGAVTDALVDAARSAGATIVTGAEVDEVATDGHSAGVGWHDQERDRHVECDWVLANVAPWALEGLLGRDPGPRPEGSQLKVNLLLERLPRLRSGESPETAFAGTFHVAEGYRELQTAYAEARAGALPTRQPGELYCHSLSDPTILGPLAERGMHTLTYFGVHTPARVFEADPQGRREEALAGAMAAFEEVLAEPLEPLLARDGEGRPCVEVKTPLDLEESLAMPGGHIFHGDLDWPWLADDASYETAAERWGVVTDLPRVLVCGSGSRRGGAVSGLGGHSAAQAVLDAP